MTAETSKDPSGYLQELVGQRCEAADNPLGSVVRFDFGPMGLGPMAGPGSKPHGWRHLTVESPWRLQTQREVLCDWNALGGKGGEIQGLVNQVVGQIVEAASSGGPAWDLHIRWANGITLVVFSDATEDREEAWSILGTDGLTLEAGPARSGQRGGSVTWAR